MPLIAVAPPYKRFIPGQGLPDVPKEGVLVSDEQDAAIRALAVASGNPDLKMLGYVYEEAFDETLASKAYIEERFVAIAADIGDGYTSVADMVDAAAASAGDAATSEANAASSANAAGASAEEADTYRVAAAVSESNAADAEAGAQTAKGEAEAARDVAVDAAATATVQVDARIALQKGEPDGLLPADENGLLPESRVPERLTPSGLSASMAQLKQWARNPDLLITGTITRDANGAATSAPVTWPDGVTGTYTADTVSTAFPGAVDAYHITYAGSTTKTFTQPAVTRDAATGAVTNAPAITVA